MHVVGADIEDVKKDGGQPLSVQIPGGTDDIVGDAQVAAVDVTSHAGDAIKQDGGSLVQSPTPRKSVRDKSVVDYNVLHGRGLNDGRSEGDNMLRNDSCPVQNTTAAAKDS
jgi:hypothetical protein